MSQTVVRRRSSCGKLCAAALGVWLALPGVATAADADYAARIRKVLAATPLIDGHNDLAWELRQRTQGRLAAIDLQKDTSPLLSADGTPLMTDIPRLRAGQMGGQFWSVWVPPDTRGPEAVQTTLEQIDVVKRMTAAYPATFEMAYTAADIQRIHRAGRIASLIGIEGGHQIGNSLATLRQMYDLGARYMTLTHTLNNDWADAATAAPVHHGLTPFGLAVVHEMNRLGMLVDLSHVSPETMNAVLDTTAAPVIFSHSAARAICDHPRNVPDDVLRRLAKNGGVVMVNFYPGYVSQAVNEYLAELAAEEARLNSPPYSGLLIGQPDKAKVALDQWKQAHPQPVVTIAQVADHIDHVRQVAGIDHVGLGADLDGIDSTPQGLEGVDGYPALLAELMRRGWSDADVAKLAGQNILRVMAEAERVAARLRTQGPPAEATVSAAP